MSIFKKIRSFFQNKQQRPSNTTTGQDKSLKSNYQPSWMYKNE